MRSIGKAISALFSQAAIIILISLLLIFTAEGIARHFVKKIQWGQPVYMIDYSDDVIRKLYNTDDPEFYRGVLSEGWDNGLKIAYEPFVEFMLRPYSGKYVTITNQGFRSAPDGPKKIAETGHSVFVFGGSTTLGMGVSDRETLPYYLQQHLRDSLPGVQVYNFGQPSWYSTQESMLFQRLLRLGHRPDVAVFVDGLNDFYFCKTPDQSSQSEKIRKRLLSAGRFNLGRILLEHSNVIKLINHWFGKTRITHEDGAFCNDESDVYAVIDRIDRNRRMISAIAREYGVAAYFVQQPVPTHAYDNDRRPVRLNKVAFGQHINSERGYQIIAERKKAGTIFDKNVLWMETENIDDNMYVDLVHYSPQFNDHLAAEIARNLFIPAQR